MSAHRSIAKKWEIFSSLYLPHDCSDIQRTEMRRAFYAGVEAAHRVLYGEVIHGTEADGIALLEEDLYQELKEFAQMVVDGKA